MIKYPSVDKIIKYNIFVLENIKVKKADKPQVLSEIRIKECVIKCKKSKGNVYHKASVLLENLVRKHPFASGNRRTALFTTIKFLNDNKTVTKIKDKPEFARVLTGIREGFYTFKEIINWLKNGKIRKFERR